MRTAPFILGTNKPLTATFTSLDKVNDEGVFSGTFGIDKDDEENIAIFNEQRDKLIESEFGGEEPVGNFSGELRDGDESRSKSKLGKMILNSKANATHQPQVFDTPDKMDMDGNPLALSRHSDLYNQAKVRVMVELYTYEYKQKKGIGCNLKGVQLIEKGKPSKPYKKTEVNVAASFGAGSIVKDEVPSVKEKTSNPETSKVRIEQPEYQMTEAANGASYQDLIDTGLSHDDIVSLGYVA